jgi:hypothetical protein
MEVWLWRWAYGDPKRATEAEGARDTARFAEIRKELRTLIQRPGLHAELEERVLARTSVTAAIPAAVETEAVVLPGPMDDEDTE